ncbi:MAG: ATP-binding cassette domain-containing protein [Ignavibacteriales bacterium]|nr:ATP-binding cassette domain-containing protein [Ignavibacteriales bacterium]
MLNVSHLRKEYDRVVAVDDVSLTVKRGEIFGLLGPNGAGKTTTIRTVLNVIQPDAGTITFDGKHFSPEMWNIIGYLPEERGLYRKSKIANTILYFASLKGLSESEARPRVSYWLERFGLKDAGHRKVEELSKGNQQKVQLICSILHKPQLLILDEPFSGLDPVNQILLKDILMELRQQDVAIVFSTHQMEQVEKMCDTICLINKGRIVLQGLLRDVKKQYGTNSIRLEFEGDGAFLKLLPIVKRADVYQNYAELELVDVTQSRELMASLDGRLNLRKFEMVEPSLQSIFINVVGMPESLEQLNPPPVAKAAQPMAPEVKKAFISFLMGILLMLGFTVVEALKEDPNWIGPLVITAAVAFSGFRFLKIKSDSERKGRESGKGGER